MTDAMKKKYMLACKTGDLQSIKAVVGQVGVNYQDETGKTGLMLSVYFGFSDVAKYLVSLTNIDINLQDRSSLTVLHFAVFGSNEEILKLLINIPGIDLNVRGTDNQTAEERAAAEGKPQLKIILEEARLEVEKEAIVKEKEAIVKENEAKKFVEDIKSIYTLDHLHDVTIVCQEEMIPCHAVILASRSSVFAAMLQHTMVEKQTKKINIKDASPNMVKIMMKHIYSGEIPEDINEVATDLIHIAEKYGLANLRNACAQVMMKDLNESNAINTLIIIDRYATMSSMKEDTMAFIWKTCDNIVGTEEWVNLLKSHTNLATDLVSFGAKLGKFTE